MQKRSTRRRRSTCPAGGSTSPNRRPPLPFAIWPVFRERGLNALTTLLLAGTQVTDAGLKELARPDSGLKALTTLDLHLARVSDAGLKELARPDNGLKALTTLYLPETKVTDAGIAELKK